MRFAKNHPGQIGLILLVILGLLVVLIMSVASRSLSDSTLARQAKEQNSTFAIAESGIEQALRAIRDGARQDGVWQLSDATNFITGQYEIRGVNEYRLFLREGESGYLDLTGYSAPTIEIDWVLRDDATENVACVSEGSGNAPAAIEITAGNTTSGVLSRAYYNSAGCSLAGNGFSPASDGGTYLSLVNYNIPPTASYLRIKTLYNGATIAVLGPGLSSQYYLILSQATGGDATKEIEVKRTLESAPTVFDYALFSGTTVVK